MHSDCSNKIEELSLMADGMLSMKNSKELEEHLLVCSTCNSYYKDIVAMKKALNTFSIDIPDDLNELIGNAVRKQSKIRKLPVHFYRYATVAAACLVLVVFFLAKGVFNNKFESADSENFNNAKMSEERSAGMSITADDSYLSAQGQEDSGFWPAPDANLPASNDKTNELYGALSDFKYTTSALENSDFIVVNPDGMPLDSGYGGMQDVFYASMAYHIEEALDILAKEFSISEVVIEDENIFFITNTNLLPKLEARLGLISAGVVSEKKATLSVRIISLKTRIQ